MPRLNKNGNRKLQNSFEKNRVYLKRNGKWKLKTKGKRKLKTNGKGKLKTNGKGKLKTNGKGKLKKLRLRGINLKQIMNKQRKN